MRFGTNTQLKFLTSLILLGIVMLACSEDTNTEVEVPIEKELIKAADVSFLPEIRSTGTIFLNSQGQASDVLDILKQAGCNTIRLRLWHTPSTHASSLAEVSTFANEVKSKGFKIWLTVHYSDTWADPGAQTKPAAWQQASFSVLSDSVYQYTRKVVRVISPDYIQIGNEINGGMLWPEGAIANRENFVTLLKQGVQAVRDQQADTKIMIHYAGTEADWFYSILKSQSVSYDIIALSYYPRWHTKSLSEVKAALSRLSVANDKDIILAETAYPFTLGWNDFTNNLVGESGHLVNNYPATPEGQKAFMLQLRSMLVEVPKGVGFAYWAPEWIAYRGEQATNGSAWENMALFDFDHKVLPAITLFTD